MLADHPKTVTEAVAARSSTGASESSRCRPRQAAAARAYREGLDQGRPAHEAAVRRHPTDAGSPRDSSIVRCRSPEAAASTSAHQDPYGDGVLLDRTLGSSASASRRGAVALIDRRGRGRRRRRGRRCPCRGRLRRLAERSARDCLAAHPQAHRAHHLEASREHRCQPAADAAEPLEGPLVLLGPGDPEAFAQLGWHQPDPAEPQRSLRRDAGDPPRPRRQRDRRHGGTLDRADHAVATDAVRTSCCSHVARKYSR